MKIKLIDAADRAVNTFAQGALTAIGGDALNLWHLDWQESLGFGLGAALLSVLMTMQSWRSRSV